MYRTALPWVLLKKVLVKLVRIETLIIYRHDMQDVCLPACTQEPTVRIARIDGTGSDLSHALCARYPDRNFRQRLQQDGSYCHVALRGDRIAGYAWVASKDLHIDEIRYRYPIAAHEIFIYDCHVDSECRGAGIYPRMLRAVLDDANRHSITPGQVCIAATAVNQASIRGITKAGFVEYKRIHYAQWQQRQWWWQVPC